MFIENKYTKWYFQIIENRKLNLHKTNVITELHHIIPKSLGGDNTASNLVRLSLREHYLCHILLTKMCKEKQHQRKMWFAIHCMTNGFGHAPRVSSILYENYRTKAMLERSEAYKGSNNPFYGKTHKESSKRYGESNPAKRETSKEKMRGPRPGFLPHNYYDGWSAETKIKISQALKGRTQTEHTKQKKREAKKNLVWVYDGRSQPKQIKKEMLTFYLEQGYKQGRGPKDLW